MIIHNHIKTWRRGGSAIAKKMDSVYRRCAYSNTIFKIIVTQTNPNFYQRNGENWRPRTPSLFFICKTRSSFSYTTYIRGKMQLTLSPLFDITNSQHILGLTYRCPVLANGFGEATFIFKVMEKWKRDSIISRSTLYRNFNLIDS